MNPTRLSSQALVTLIWRILEFERRPGIWGDDQTIVFDQGGITT